ncbi:SLAP domain-containing protein [Bacillus sp. P14.5]|uniref:SLAP domain-containing protein n=1 Tax=Bacillus sp. P14.5 TaxID=1983400 RepID=UPI000DEBCF20|nr:SLAP domain-containing protein [Bacillus sp. P14.5]
MNAQKENESLTEKLYQTSLYFPAAWRMTDQEKYIYMFHHAKLTALREDQLSFSGIDLVENDDKSIVITAFIRNAFKKLAKLQNIVITVLDGKQQKVASKLVDLGDLDSLPPFTSVPWRFLFSKEDRYTDKPIDKDGWKLLVDLKPKIIKPTLDLDPVWTKKLSDTQKGALQRIVDQQPTLVNKNDFNLMGLELHLDQNEREIIVNVFLRNTTEQTVKLESLSLALEDAYETEITRNNFFFKELEVKPNTYKPWSFIFPLSDDHDIENLDLRRWRVTPVNMTVVN